MRLPGRMRRWFKRAGVLACIALVAGWIVSEFSRRYLQGRSWSVDLEGGAICIRHIELMGAGPVTPGSWGFYRDYAGRPQQHFLLLFVGRFRSVQGWSPTASGPAKFLSAGRVLMFRSGFLSWFWPWGQDGWSGSTAAAFHLTAARNAGTTSRAMSAGSVPSAGRGFSLPPRPRGKRCVSRDSQGYRGRDAIGERSLYNSRT
jgi:hypothetical protein